MIPYFCKNSNRKDGDEVKSGGSYATINPGVCVKGGRAEGNNTSVSLFSAGYHEAGDWPVAPPWVRKDGSCVQVYCAPTRTSQVHYIYTWYSYDQEGSYTADTCLIHLCTNNPNPISNYAIPDSEWDGSGSGLYLERLGVVQTISGYIPSECEIAHSWIDPSSYPGCYMVIEIIGDNADGKRYSTVQSLPYPLSHYRSNVGNAPSLTYDKSTHSVTIGTSMRGRRILEFYDTSAISTAEISGEETLMNFYLSSLINLEESGDYRAYYKAYDNGKLWRWGPGTYSVSFIDTLGDDMSDYVSKGVDNAISSVGGVMSEFGINFYRDDTLGSGADIPVTYGTMQSLWPDLYPNGYDGGTLQGGLWAITSANGHCITGAKVGIAREGHYYSTFAQLCFEEFYGCMGCGYDQWEYPMNTTTLQIGCAAMPSEMTNKDADMLRLLYSDAVNAGDDVTAVALAHNIPKGVKFADGSRADTQRTVSLDFLAPGHTYEVRVWIADLDGSISATSDWIEVASSTIVPWSWAASNGSAGAEQTKQAYDAVSGHGAVSDFSYLVWNDLVDKVNSVIISASDTWSTMYATIDETRMTVSDKVLTAKRFNALRQNIGARYSTGIEEVSPGDIVLGNYFTTLTKKLNEWITKLQSQTT